MGWLYPSAATAETAIAIGPATGKEAASGTATDAATAAASDEIKPGEISPKSLLGRAVVTGRVEIRIADAGHPQHGGCGVRLHSSKGILVLEIPGPVR